MKIPCEMIKDLLPLYYDDICSDITKEMVSTHLSHCKECKRQLEGMEEDSTDIEIGIDEIEPIKQISIAWKKEKMKYFKKGILVTIIIGVLSILFVIMLVIPRPLPSKFYEVSQVCRLENGRLLYYKDVKDGPYINTMRYKVVDGALYLTPVAPIITRNLNIDNSRWDGYICEDIEGRTYDVFEDNRYVRKEITSFYMGSKNDKILIWEKGMDLPKASDELEKKYGHTK